MALKGNADYIYSGCDHIKRVKPDFSSVDESTAKEIGGNYRTLPTFEQSLFDVVLAKHYSLARNELLRCRWTEYKRQVEGREFAPFQFPDCRDLHFHDCAIRFLPSESIHKRPSIELRKHLKPGPGVDFGSFGGQKPIPFELIMKRGVARKYNDTNVKEKQPFLKKNGGIEKKYKRGH